MTENRAKWIESRQEFGGKPLKSPKIGFGDFAWEVGRKKHRTPSLPPRIACKSQESFTDKPLQRGKEEENMVFPDLAFPDSEECSPSFPSISLSRSFIAQ